MAISPVERERIKKLKEDPVYWARIFLVANNAAEHKWGPWKARWYQEEMLRDRSTRKVYRCGRRTGKSETMIVDALHMAFTNKMFRILFVTPYENQVNLIFMRMRELIADSPLLKQEVVKMKNSPYTVELKNGSAILGFTSGASSGSGAASIRGQRADWIFMDEIDYMGPEDYSTVAAIAGERVDIGITASSTPTGKRGTFYRMCTDKSFGYHEHFHPSMHNPNWCDEMEAQFRGELNDSQYEHEILAEFGTEETGVFNKDKLELATKHDFYTYLPLNDIQKKKYLEEEGCLPTFYDYGEHHLYPYNPFICVGVDWDAYGASSSIVVLEFDVNLKKFRVIKRIEVPRSEYNLDNAVKHVIRVNEIYNPAWIYVDRGYGDYQLERLHIYGDEHPESGLKTKVKGWQFKNSLEIMDPITKETKKEPMKPFMVNQLGLTIDRERLVLSPCDKTLQDQLINYSVERISQSGQPVYTSKEEHFVDALGLAHLAFVLEFPKITQLIKVPEFSSKILHSSKLLGEKRVNKAFRDIEQPTLNPWRNRMSSANDDDDLPGDKPCWIKVPMGRGHSPVKTVRWGSRTGRGFSGRSTW